MWYKVLLFALGLLLVGCATETGDDMGIDNLGGNSDHILGGGYSGSKGWQTHGILTTGVSKAAKSVSGQAVFPDSDNRTVQFSANIPPGIYAAPQARITFSVEGNDTTRIVDLGTGVSVTGTAQAVKVVMYDASTPANLAFINSGQPPTDYTVDVLVSTGTRGSFENPPTLIATDPRPNGPGGTSGFYDIEVANDGTNPPGSRVQIPIPPDAGVVAVFVTAYQDSPTNGVPASGAGRVTQQMVGGVSGILDYRVEDASDVDHWTPVTPGSNFIELAALGGTLLAPVEIQYTVTFGIDG